VRGSGLCASASGKRGKQFHATREGERKDLLVHGCGPVTNRDMGGDTVHSIPSTQDQQDLRKTLA